MLLFHITSINIFTCKVFQVYNNIAINNGLVKIHLGFSLVVLSIHCLLSSHS